MAWVLVFGIAVTSLGACAYIRRTRSIKKKRQQILPVSDLEGGYNSERESYRRRSRYDAPSTRAVPSHWQDYNRPPSRRLAQPTVSMMMPPPQKVPPIAQQQALPRPTESSVLLPPPPRPPQMIMPPPPKYQQDKVQNTSEDKHAWRPSKSPIQKKQFLLPPPPPPQKTIMPPPPPKYQQDKVQYISEDNQDWRIGITELQIEEKIGGGAFGSVHKGIFRGTEVAIKVVQGGPAELKSFEHEAKMLASLRHPNVCLFMGACLDKNSQFWTIITEYVPRGSLWDVLREDGIDWNFKHRKIHVALGIARGLAYLHAHSPPVLHRDIKSANVLCDDTFRVKLCDVGLARRSNACAQMTVGCGTPNWMAPEVSASGAYGTPADVYSFAIVLAELAIPGHLPFSEYPNLGGFALALKVVQQGLRPNLPNDCIFAQLARSCWAPLPRDRPPISHAITSLSAMLLHSSSGILLR